MCERARSARRRELYRSCPVFSPVSDGDLLSYIPYFVLLYTLYTRLSALSRKDKMWVHYSLLVLNQLRHNTILCSIRLYPRHIIPF